jgi:hypothetical protein
VETVAFVEEKSMHRPQVKPLTPLYHVEAQPIPYVANFKIVVPSRTPSSPNLLSLAQRQRVKSANRQNPYGGHHYRRAKFVRDVQPQPL